MSNCTEMLEAALDYSRRGWPVFPLHTPRNGGCSCGKATCRKSGKHPRTEHGLADATTDEGQIRTWWSRWPEANIGIRTGGESEILVVDLDGTDGRESMRELVASHGELPTTLTVRTGNGKHLYFAHPLVAVKNSTGKVARGIDIRADGGYVVAGPSLHSTGTRYEIEKPEQKLAEVPDWLIEKMVTQDFKTREDKMQDVEHHPFSDAPVVVEGKRNDTLHKVGSSLRGQLGMEQERIENILLEYNNAKCHPPLDEVEVLQIVASVCKYPAEFKEAKSSKRQEENPIYWFKFNLRDFFADQNLMLMTDYQTGWYIRLKALAWQNGGLLPADKKKLFKLAKARSQKIFERDCDLVLEGYEDVILNSVPMLRNPRMAAQYASVLDGWLQKKEAGQASKAARLSGGKSHEATATIH